MTTKMSREDSRIRDVVRDSKILRDILSKLGSFTSELNCSKDGYGYLGEKCYLSAYITSRIRMKIRFLNGTSDNLVDWLDAVEDFFVQMDIPEQLKCKIACYSLEEEADRWWHRLQQELIENGKEMVSTWSKMKDLLLNRFIPARCLTKLPNQFQQENEEKVKHMMVDEFAHNKCSMKVLFQLSNIGQKQIEGCDSKDESNYLSSVSDDACKTVLPPTTIDAKRKVKGVEARTECNDSFDVHTTKVVVSERLDSAIEVKQRKGVAVVKHLKADRFMPTTCSTKFLNQLNIHGTNAGRLSKILIENFDPGGKWPNKLGMENEQGQKHLRSCDPIDDSRYLWLNTADAYKLPKSRDVPIDAAGHDAIIVDEEENAQLIASNLPIKKAKSEFAVATHFLASTQLTGEEIPIVIETRMIISELKLSNIYGVESIVEEKNEAFHRSLALVLTLKTPKGSIRGAFHAKFIDQTLQGPPIPVARVDGICMTLQDQVSHKHEEQRDDKLPKLVNRFGGGMCSFLNDNGNLAYKPLGKCMATIYSVTKHLSFLIDPGGALYSMRTRGTSLTTEISIDFLSFGTGHDDHVGILLSVALYMIFDPGGNGQNRTESEITLNITLEIKDDDTGNILEQVKLVIAKIGEAVHRKAILEKSNIVLTLFLTTISVVLNRPLELRQKGLVREIVQWYIHKMMTWLATNAGIIFLRSLHDFSAFQPMRSSHISLSCSANAKQPYIVVLFYSAGSTVANKGVELLHRNFISDALMRKDQDLAKQMHNVFLCILTLSHVFRLSNIVFAELQRRNIVVSMAKYHLGLILKEIVPLWPLLALLEALLDFSTTTASLKDELFEFGGWNDENNSETIGKIIGVKLILWFRLLHVLFMLLL